MRALIILASALCNVKSIEILQDLSGKMWSAVGTNPPTTSIVMLSSAEVPGSIHIDWFRQTSFKVDANPYYRFNDANQSWIAEYNWKYERNFGVKYERQKHTLLICEGLDTVAKITLNGEIVGNSSNMFLKTKFDVTQLLQKKFNIIQVAFESAVKYANNLNSSQLYVIPPECPPNVQHGFCHVNLIRKEQSSFSWDWGPGFATQGIWKPMYLLSFNEAVLEYMTVLYDWDTHVLTVDLRFHAADEETVHGKITISIAELGVLFANNITLYRTPGFTATTQIKLNLTNINFTKWWPNGYGEQKLYLIQASFESDMNDTSSKEIQFGFRKVELIQDSINGSDGLSFYFRINDCPIFIKGSNWIPADDFQTRVKMERYENLLQSAKDANMNALRVWGGGVYESDEFYELADKLGIMIWQDFMFACAMYPADKEFLQSVSEEVNSTLWRLKSHPSIIIWSGNNENEAALSTNWYGTKSHYDRYRDDYLALYMDTIQHLVTMQDGTRPFLTSSPTNAKETMKEGGVAENPYDTHFGDVHYYNYNDDCMDWTKYPKTRFASEYGFQSWPSIETLEPVTITEDLNYFSQFSMHRQHHQNGNQEMLSQIQMHFNLPTSEANKTEEFADLIYLTQTMQALCYKSQTDFYRKSRDEIVNGEGHTMGALYWQLNDIWQAPTWSSIEYGGKWKALHYYAHDFFAPVSIVAYNDDTQLVIYTVSDGITPIEPVTLLIEMRQWHTFGILNTWTQPLYIPPLSSKQQYKNSIGVLLHYGGCDYKELCYFTIRLKEMSDVPIVPFFPVPLKTIVGLKQTNITVSQVSVDSKKPSSTIVKQIYNITLSSKFPAAFVWLEAYGIKGRFSENLFLMFEETKTVKFYAWEKSTVEKLKKGIKIKHLADLYHTESDPPTARIGKTNYVEININTYWLEKDNIQIAWAMCGVLFILFFASMFVCVVLRLNKPRHKYPVITMTNPSNERKRSIQTAQQILAPITHKPLLEDNFNEMESASFVIKSKRGYGHNGKSIEIRFHII